MTFRSNVFIGHTPLFRNAVKNASKKPRISKEVDDITLLSTNGGVLRRALSDAEEVEIQRIRNRIQKEIEDELFARHTETQRRVQEIDSKIIAAQFKGNNTQSLIIEKNKILDAAEIDYRRAVRKKDEIEHLIKEYSTPLSCTSYVSFLGLPTRDLLTFILNLSRILGKSNIKSKINTSIGVWAKSIPLIRGSLPDHWDVCKEIPSLDESVTRYVLIYRNPYLMSGNYLPDVNTFLDMIELQCLKRFFGGPHVITSLGKLDLHVDNYICVSSKQDPEIFDRYLEGENYVDSGISDPLSRYAVIKEHNLRDLHSLRNLTEKIGLSYVIGFSDTTGNLVCDFKREGPTAISPRIFLHYDNSDGLKSLYTKGPRDDDYITASLPTFTCYGGKKKKKRRCLMPYTNTNSVNKKEYEDMDIREIPHEGKFANATNLTHLMDMVSKLKKAGVVIEEDEIFFASLISRLMAAGADETANVESLLTILEHFNKTLNKRIDSACVSFPALAMCKPFLKNLQLGG